MKTTIMSHFDTYNLVVMIDNEVTPTELFNHFLQKKDVNSVAINYDKEADCDGLLFTYIKLVSDGGNYYEINADKLNLLNLNHYMNINW